MDSLDARVSIVIPSLNTRDLLRSCLRSWMHQRPAANVEVIVVDMSSSDGTLEMIHTEFPECRVIQDVPNRGYGAAVNVGVKQATGEWVVAANSDVEFEDPLFLVRLVSQADDWGSDRAIFGVRLLNPDGSYQRSARALPGRYALAAMFFAPLRYLRGANARALGYIDDGSLSTPSRVGWLTGAVLLLRRDFFESLGGFDELFFMNSEEVDLCARAYQVGGQVVFIPTVSVTHCGGGSVPSRSDALRWLAQGKVRYTRKHFGRVAVLVARVSAVLAYCLSVPVWVLRGMRSGKHHDSWNDAVAYARALKAALRD
ncbi:MAG: glycosyltransferase family 2 protein [Coriobacteriia bacterium]